LRVGVEDGEEFRRQGFQGILGPGQAKSERADALTPTSFAATKRAVMSSLPPCPDLPTPRPSLDWKLLGQFRDQHRGADFYLACLEYAHSLWQRGFAARAVLCLDRALGAELKGDEAVLRSWPLPYAAIRWFITHTPDSIFLGNPRVHFQHYAGRMNEPRREQRRWRAWACWAIVRGIRPALPGDPLHPVVEPSSIEIERALRRHGHPGEAELWLKMLSAG
jgi:hypothetical protein